MSSDLPAHPASRNWWRFRAGLDKAGLTDRLTDPGRPELQPAEAVACTGCGTLLYERGASIRFELPGRGRVVLLCASCSETFGDLVEERGLSHASPLPLVTEASCTGTLTSLGDEQFLVCKGECPVHICTATTCGCQFGKGPTSPACARQTSRARASPNVLNAALREREIRPATAEPRKSTSVSGGKHTPERTEGMDEKSLKLAATFGEAVREAAIDLINAARDAGETDMRTLRHRVNRLDVRNIVVQAAQALGDGRGGEPCLSLEAKPLMLQRLETLKIAIDHVGVAERVATKHLDALRTVLEGLPTAPSGDVMLMYDYERGVAAERSRCLSIANFFIQTLGLKGKQRECDVAIQIRQRIERADEPEAEKPESRADKAELPDARLQKAEPSEASEASEFDAKRKAAVEAEEAEAFAALPKPGED